MWLELGDDVCSPRTFFLNWGVPDACTLTSDAFDTENDFAGAFDSADNATCGMLCELELSCIFRYLWKRTHDKYENDIDTVAVRRGREPRTRRIEAKILTHYLATAWIVDLIVDFHCRGRADSYSINWNHSIYLNHLAFHYALASNLAPSCVHIRNGGQED